MAFLYRHPGSPFWWIRYRDPATRQPVRRSTGKRADSKQETREAKAEAARLTAAELGASPTETSASRWETWAVSFLRFRYANPGQACTRERFLGAWDHISDFLRRRKIRKPAELRREHLQEYLAARTGVQRVGRPVTASTASLELKALSVLMEEAVARGWATRNPCRRLGIRKPSPSLKPEIPESMMARIEELIELEPQGHRTMMRRSFLIARYQGCRLSETRLDLAQDVVRSAGGLWSIRFRIKGGRVHVAPMHPKLIPHFEAWIAAGERHTYLQPGGRTRLSSLWTKFFHRHGLTEELPGICFHSLRVTAVTRLARANVPEAKCRAFIGHASETVHRIYQRLRPEDLGDCFSPLEPRTGSLDGPPASAS